MIPVSKELKTLELIRNQIRIITGFLICHESIKVNPHVIGLCNEYLSGDSVERARNNIYCFRNDTQHLYYQGNPYSKNPPTGTV